MLAAGCNKTFLDAKPDQALLVPKTAVDFQAILDNDAVMNGATNNGLVPALGEIGADNYYTPFFWFSDLLTPYDLNCYTWAKVLYTGEPVFDWNIPYKSVFYANVVLDGLPAGGLDTLRGSALFYRAHAFYQLAQVFAPPYDPGTAGTLPGIPLRLTSDINEKISRAGLQATYDQVLRDLRACVPMLPVTVAFKTRPSRPAAYALLARIYLTMQDYAKAKLYADSCLQLQSALLDYNTLDATAGAPFPRFNEEVLFHCNLVGYNRSPVVPGIGLADSVLYASYQYNDLRKALFFTPGSDEGMVFKGTYDGSFNLFGGLATDEVFLVRAECLARAGNTAGALADLNRLLKTRWAAGTFKPLTAATAEEALRLVLVERRKELVFRGLRWTDLRRLNQDTRFAVTLTRLLDGVTYTLPPKDVRYTYPIPPDVVGFNPGMEQNPR